MTSQRATARAPSHCTWWQCEASPTPEFRAETTCNRSAGSPPAHPGLQCEPEKTPVFSCRTEHCVDHWLKHNCLITFHLRSKTLLYLQAWKRLLHSASWQWWTTLLPVWCEQSQRTTVKSGHQRHGSAADSLPLRLHCLFLQIMSHFLNVISA